MTSQQKAALALIDTFRSFLVEAGGCDHCLELLTEARAHAAASIDAFEAERRAAGLS